MMDVAARRGSEIASGDQQGQLSEGRS